MWREGLILSFFVVGTVAIYSVPTTCQALGHMLLGQLPTHYSSPPHEAGTDLHVRSWSALPVLAPGGTAERWGAGMWTQGLNLRGEGASGLQIGPESPGCFWLRAFSPEHVTTL